MFIDVPPGRCFLTLPQANPAADPRAGPNMTEIAYETTPSSSQSQEYTQSTKLDSFLGMLLRALDLPDMGEIILSVDGAWHFRRKTSVGGFRKSKEKIEVAFSWLNFLRWINH